MSGAAVTLGGGTPAGGSYSGTGVSGGKFDPAVAGAGTFTITYSYTDGNGCSGSASQPITVNALPTVSLAALSPVCVSGAAVTLGGGTPAGGSYSGTGVSAGKFDPAVAGAGTFTITYSYTDGNGCSGSASQPITVNALPTVSLAALSPVCVSGAAVTLGGGTPAGGSYSGTGVSAGKFDPAVAGAGTLTITYSYTDGTGAVGARASRSRSMRCRQ